MATFSIFRNSDWSDWFVQPYGEHDEFRTSVADGETFSFGGIIDAVNQGIAHDAADPEIWALIDDDCGEAIGRYADAVVFDSGGVRVALVDADHNVVLGGDIAARIRSQMHATCEHGHGRLGGSSEPCQNSYFKRYNAGCYGSAWLCRDHAPSAQALVDEANAAERANGFAIAQMARDERAMMRG